MECSIRSPGAVNRAATRPADLWRKKGLRASRQQEGDCGARGRSLRLCCWADTGEALLRDGAGDALAGPEEGEARAGTTVVREQSSVQMCRQHALLSSFSMRDCEASILQQPAAGSQQHPASLQRAWQASDGHTAAQAQPQPLVSSLQGMRSAVLGWPAKFTTRAPISVLAAVSCCGAGVRRAFRAEWWSCRAIELSFAPGHRHQRVSAPAPAPTDNRDRPAPADMTSGRREAPPPCCARALCRPGADCL